MKFQKDPVFGFTTRAPGRLRVLQSEVFVSEAYDHTSGLPEPIRQKFHAIWDTGATGTVIQRKIAVALGLQPSGKSTVHAVGSGGVTNTYEADTYLVNIYLPNNVAAIGIKAVEGTIMGGDMLLGMDIIGAGDFAVTNCGGKTCFTFRYPSVEEIDFVQEINEHNAKYRPVNRSREEERRKRQLEKRLKR